MNYNLFCLGLIKSGSTSVQVCLPSSVIAQPYFYLAPPLSFISDQDWLSLVGITNGMLTTAIHI